MNIRGNAAICLSLFGLLMLSSVVAESATVRYPTTIVRILQDDTANRFAGCMALLDDDPAARVEVNCRRGWVTMDCSGELGTSRSHSSALFSSAQAASILKQQVFVTLDDSRTASNYCLLEILESFPPN